MYGNRIHVFMRKSGHFTYRSRKWERVDMGIVLAHLMIAIDDLWIDAVMSLSLIHIYGLTEEASFAMLKEAAAAGRLKTDIVCYADLLKAPGLVQKEPEYDRRYHRHLKIGGYKIILDGSPQGRTAWLSKPYEDAKDGYSGYPVYTQEQVDTYVERSKEEGRQLLVHCNGDAAAEQMIRACRKPSKLRPVMIHAQTVRRDQLVRMKELGIIPSFFIAHVYHWGEIHRKNLGEERSERISPAREAADLQMPYTCLLYTSSEPGTPQVFLVNRLGS